MELAEQNSRNNIKFRLSEHSVTGKKSMHGIFAVFGVCDLCIFFTLYKKRKIAQNYLRPKIFSVEIIKLEEIIKQ